MTGEERAAVEEVIRELQGDVNQARTRDESSRLLRRVMRLQAILAHPAALTAAPSPAEPLEGSGTGAKPFPPPWPL